MMLLTSCCYNFRFRKFKNLNVIRHTNIPWYYLVLPVSPVLVATGCVTIVQASTANDYPVARFHFINENVIHIRIEPPGNQKHDFDKFQIRFEDRDSDRAADSDSHNKDSTTTPPPPPTRALFDCIFTHTPHHQN